MIPLITGSDGYIGTNLKYLLDQNNQPYYGIDRKSGPDILSASGRQLFEEYLETADVVIHLAGRPRIPPSWTETDLYIKDNIELTEYVADECARKNKYLVFASSSSVYGDKKGPLNPYSWTKKSCEELIQFKAHKGLKYTIARIHTTYGNNGPLVIDTWLDRYHRGLPLIIRGDGKQKRDFIHVEDVCQALYNAALYRPKNCTADIGTGENFSLKKIAKIFKTEVIYEDELPGYARETRANTGHANRKLNWCASVYLPDWIEINLDN